MDPIRFLPDCAAKTAAISSYRYEGIRAMRKGRESLSEWRDLSRHARDLLEIAARLRGEDEIRDEIRFDEWRRLASSARMLSGIGPSLCLGTGEGVAALQATQRAHGGWRRHGSHHLEAEIAAWNMTYGPVSFGVERVRDEHNTAAGWNTVLNFGGSLPCYLGLQLMTAIAGGAIFICSACNYPYIRDGKAPKPGERNYCMRRECKREGNRLVVERRRQRDKERKQAL